MLRGRLCYALLAPDLDISADSGRARDLVLSHSRSLSINLRFRECARVFRTTALSAQ
jgi:hypothetical protein